MPRICFSGSYGECGPKDAIDTKTVESSGGRNCWGKDTAMLQYQMRSHPLDLTNPLCPFPFEASREKKLIKSTNDVVAIAQSAYASVAVRSSLAVTLTPGRSASVPRPAWRPTCSALIERCSSSRRSRRRPAQASVAHGEPGGRARRCDRRVD
jgi:hypothetical protein